MGTRVIQGNVFDVLPTLAAGSVDCAVTSPPYWKLRSYLPKDHPLKPLELGSEATPAEYVARQVEVFRLVRDVMAPHATLWLNVGDTYSGGTSCSATNSRKQKSSVGTLVEPTRYNSGISDGNLCLIPWRLAIALQDDGWLVRSVVVWHKPAPMPASLSGWRWARCRVKGAKKDLRQTAKRLELGDGHERQSTFKARSVTGESIREWADCPGCKKCERTGGYVLRKGSWRPTSSWEPVLMLAKGAGYFCDGIAVQQPAAEATISRNDYTRILDDPDEQFAVKHDHETELTTANLRDVWTIAAEPLKEKHYAAFPTELVHRCLKAGTSAKGYCQGCGKPWVRVVETKFYGDCRAGRRDADEEEGKNEWRGTAGVDYEPPRTLDWRPSCACLPTSPRPGLVLDPFAGSGRTGIEAGRLGLDFVGVELSPEYAALSGRLLRDEAPLFAEGPAHDD